MPVLYTGIHIYINITYKYQSDKGTKYIHVHTYGIGTGGKVKYRIKNRYHRMKKNKHDKLQIVRKGQNITVTQNKDTLI